MGNFMFRNAVGSDLEGIVAIYNSVVASRMVTADTEPVTVESRRVWFDAHDPARRPLWVVEQEGTMIGWVSFQSFYDRPAYDATVEISLYLHPDHRGKGLGHQVLGVALQKASELGLRNIVGFIFSHNAPSIALFTKEGFKEWGRLPGVAVLDGIERTVLILGKKI
jgi:phosphinothricin acetyltransferase